MFPTLLTSRPVLVIIGSGDMGIDIARRLGDSRLVLLADFSKTHRGSIEVIVYTAGVSPVNNTTSQIYKINLIGSANVIDSFLMVASPGTSMICITSMAAQNNTLSSALEQHLAKAPRDQLLQHAELDLSSSDTMSAYGISKRGNILRVQAACYEWGQRGARINSVSPGVILTAMSERAMQGNLQESTLAQIEASGARRRGYWVFCKSGCFIYNGDGYIGGWGTDTWTAVACGGRPLIDQ
ncbi:uncharacterized protein LDX57_000463 [Aspergillus melleus]|uniref:uncharacterized protein n=1 Tax=Aspergillus melleus TaxID=138277 RepID=UPI001E8E49F3|nr:uncharacterized protein LDX57_000463 [Aspergillus melleus]KAH8422709.1 hypothetical protein LDX57_000463 [Aspergillus melleus]